MNNFTGPRLSDEDFFLQCVDTTLPGLAEVRQAAENGDFAKAKHLFAAYIRTHLQYEKFFSIPYEFPENAFYFKGETELQMAQRICSHLLISCHTPMQFGQTVDWFCNPTYNGYKEWTWQLSRHDEFKLLAHVYRATGDETYAKAFAQLFESWVRQATVPDPCPGGATLCWRTIECGLRMGASWPYALHTFAQSPAFTDDLLVDWYKSVWEHGWRLHDHHATGNWLIMEMNGLSQIGILYPELKDSKAWLAFAFDMLEKEIDSQVYPDGFQYELASGYHYVVVNNYFRLIKVASAYGIDLPRHIYDRLEDMLDLYIRSMGPDGCMPGLNDSGPCCAKELIALFASYFPHNETFRWVLTDGKEGRKPDYTSIALPYSGMFFMRTGWDKNAVYGMLEFAPFGKGHQHEDKLSFLLAAYGKQLLPDAGSFSYDESPMRKYVLSTRSHNTVRVDDMDQNRRQNYVWHDEDLHKPAGLHWRCEDAFDYADGTYDEGYGNLDAGNGFELPPEEDRPALFTGVQHSRSVIFFKKPPMGAKPFFVVTDRLQATDGAAHTYEALWHITQEKVAVNDMTVKSDNLYLIGARQELSTWVELVKGVQSPRWQGWKTLTGKQMDWQPMFTAKFMGLAENLRMVTLVYPTDDGTCPFTRVDADPDIAATKFTLHTADGALELNEADYAACTAKR